MKFFLSEKEISVIYQKDRIRKSTVSRKTENQLCHEYTKKTQTTPKSRKSL